MDGKKRCYQMLNGLLIEGTAESIIPDLKNKQSQILAQIKQCESVAPRAAGEQS